ncbi:NPCBM/NEW2 domain-containing protein [Lentzea nigeriaca]|uniref:NPCBM/NEW2 domain-containing protein n=1 Tax=Lentzea nigeriaca TaxID=1128665 RepID=UPI00195E8CE5|nr:NPCBM/NEW2 domain-containing protein [Lentzea nigeriaca]MBM7863037.1 hypothetical protein [Lentzea nigeriaca]
MSGKIAVLVAALWASGMTASAAQAAPADPVSACALPKQATTSESVPADWSTFAATTGTVKAAVLFRGSWDVDAELTKLEEAERFYATASYGRYKLELVPYRTPVDIPDPVAPASAWAEAAKRADPDFDFSGISAVYLVDRGARRSYTQADTVTLDGRPITVGAVIGPGDISTPARDHFAWHKWKHGWLDDDQMSCVATRNTSVQQTLTPVETAGGSKAIVVRYGTTRAYVAEVRARKGLDSGACDTGVLIYSIGSGAQSGEEPVRVRDAKPRSGGCGGNELADAAHDPGQSFMDSRSRVRIDVVSRSGDNYVVRATYGQDGLHADAVISAPVMGWNSWNRFGCDINENLIREAAHAIVANGLNRLGYNYVNIDDCWMASTRDGEGRLQANPARFPSGIRALADHVHGLGLKLGIYSSAGTLTCQGYPASLDNETIDAQTFADWGVDLLKYDNCHNQGRPAAERYAAMGEALRATGRPIVYSICDWGQEEPWIFGPQVGGDYWRTTGDIVDKWDTVMDLLDQQVGLESFSSQGSYNDPDMLEVGNGGMTSAEYISHFSLWSLLSSPLLLGNDLDSMDSTTLAIIRNREVIEVNQDWAGSQGRKIRDDGAAEVWAKPMSDGSVAVVLFNRGAVATTIRTSAAELGLAGSSSYRLRDLWTGRSASTTGAISASVGAHGVVMYRVSRTGTLAPGPAEGTHEVGNMNWEASTNSWGPVERNTSNGEEAAGDGNTLTIEGTTYSQGIGAHADSAVHLYLGRACSTFSAQVGIDDEVSDEAASVRFLVYGDGELLADSGVKTADRGPSTLEVTTTGYATLELRVTDARDGNLFDHADWGDPVLTCD